MKYLDNILICMALIALMLVCAILALLHNNTFIAVLALAGQAALLAIVVVQCGNFRKILEGKE